MMAPSIPLEKQPRSERLEARVTPEQKAQLNRAAALSGCSLTDFVVRSAQAEAQRTIREHEVMVLSRRDAEAFVAALMEDWPPNERLRKAAERFGNGDES